MTCNCKRTIGGLATHCNKECPECDTRKKQYHLGDCASRQKRQTGEDWNCSFTSDNNGGFTCTEECPEELKNQFCPKTNRSRQKRDTVIVCKCTITNGVCDCSGDCPEGTCDL